MYKLLIERTIESQRRKHIHVNESFLNRGGGLTHNLIPVYHAGLSWVSKKTKTPANHTQRPYDRAKGVTIGEVNTLISLLCFPLMSHLNAGMWMSHLDIRIWRYPTMLILGAGRSKLDVSCFRNLLGAVLFIRNSRRIWKRTLLFQSS